MKRLLLIALLLIIGCSEKSVDKTTLFKKDEPIYGGQKKLPGKFIKASLGAPTTGAGQEPSLTIDRIVSQPSITGTAPSSPSWSADSRQLAFLWNDSGLPRREIWIVKSDGSGLRQLTSEIEGTRGVDLFKTDGQSLELRWRRFFEVCADGFWSEIYCGVAGEVGAGFIEGDVSVGS